MASNYNYNMEELKIFMSHLFYFIFVIKQMLITKKLNIFFY
jgi:hypothetical protein